MFQAELSANLLCDLATQVVSQPLKRTYNFRVFIFQEFITNNANEALQTLK